jgi:hypothetical protein
MHPAEELHGFLAAVGCQKLVELFPHESTRSQGSPREILAVSEETPSGQKVTLRLSPQAEKYARRDAPLEARRMAARGALPLEPIELSTVLFVLANDPDPEVKETARRSLESLPDHILSTTLKGEAHPALLSFMAQIHKENDAHCEALALNPATDDRTVAFLATLPHSRVVDIISQNQERMLRYEGIVDALGANPLTGRAVIERILSFLGIDEREAAEDEDEALDESEAEAALAEMLGDGMREIARLLASESEVDDEALEGSLYAVVQQMSVMQKIKLARLGGKEARALLVKDRNRIVSSSVLASPKLTETEVVGFAQSRSIGEELLRIISSNREWTKNYQVKIALASNPKTPPPQAIKFLNYLQDKDLRMLMKSKDVPSNISSHARRILTKKGKL